MRRKRNLAVAVLSLLGLSSTVSSADATIVNSAVIAVRADQTAFDEAAFRAFNDAIVEYVRLQRRLRGEVPGLVVTTESRNISNASDTLAAAIQRARRAAKKGDIFDKAATSAIAGRLRVALQGVDIATFVNGINDESTFKGQPRVHMRFPEAAPMATMPASLLELLPQLPAELEYRFLGRHLILRDRDAALVLDYVADAIPMK